MNIVIAIAAYFILGFAISGCASPKPGSPEAVAHAIKEQELHDLIKIFRVQRSGDWCIVPDAECTRQRLEDECLLHNGQLHATPRLVDLCAGSPKVSSAGMVRVIYGSHLSVSSCFNHNRNQRLRKTHSTRGQ